MSSNDKTDENGLANLLFSQPIGAVASAHLDKAGQDLQRGAIEQANEHIKRGEKALVQFILSPDQLSQLTSEENKEWNDLNAKYFHPSDSETGLPIRQTAPVSEEDMTRIHQLQNKAQGISE